MTTRLNHYLSLSGQKSGFLMAGGEAKYLFGNRYCPAECRLVKLKTDTSDILTQYSDEMLVTVSGEKQPTVFINGKRILRLQELVLIYSVLTSSGELYGVISGGEYPAGDFHFTEQQLCELLVTALTNKQERLRYYTSELIELKKQMENNEIKALNGLYLDGNPIEEE